MKITIKTGEWGEAQQQDVLNLLADTASHVNRLLRQPFTGTIIVKAVPGGSNPKVQYRATTDDPFTIQLTSSNRFWCQYAYQFSHEFCHVISGYERLKHNPNNWFHEAVCELASIFTMRRMSERWLSNPPYPHWSSYAPSLADYAANVMSIPAAQLENGISLQTWLREHEDTLRTDPRLRNWNLVVSKAMLPHFEAEPGGWNAITKMPTSHHKLKAYLEDWHEAVSPEDKAFVAKLIELLATA